MGFTVRNLTREDVAEVAALQPLAFPPPFPPDLLWSREHLLCHQDRFPQGQFVAEVSGVIVASASATRIQDETWLAHKNWEETVGGPFISTFSPTGSTLYGLDITVHPEYRRMGIGRALYEARYALVRSMGLTRYGTSCRLPDYASAAAKDPITVDEYAKQVVAGLRTDRTLSPMLRYGVRFLTVLHDYMEDEESANAAALLEWVP
jgi:ribosomal protein S18 acetylase RimI-like enzyme